MGNGDFQRPDGRDVLPAWLKHTKNPLPWGALSEENQHQAVMSATTAAKRRAAKRRVEGVERAGGGKWPEGHP